MLSIIARRSILFLIMPTALVAAFTDCIDALSGQTSLLTRFLDIDAEFNISASFRQNLHDSASFGGKHAAAI